MSQLRTNFIPKGKFDKNIYIENNDIDPRVQTKEFLGNFVDNFMIRDNIDKNSIEQNGIFMSNYGLSPQPIKYARYDRSFKLSDTYIPPDGSNLNGFGKPIHPLNALDLYEDIIYKKMKSLDLSNDKKNKINIGLNYVIKNN